MFTEDGMPVSPRDNNTRMSDVDLENISSDSGEIVSSLNMVSVFSTNQHSIQLLKTYLFISISITIDIIIRLMSATPTKIMKFRSPISQKLVKVFKQTGSMFYSTRKSICTKKSCS